LRFETARFPIAGACPAAALRLYSPELQGEREIDDAGFDAVLSGFHRIQFFEDHFYFVAAHSSFAFCSKAGIQEQCIITASGLKMVFGLGGQGAGSREFRIAAAANRRSRLISIGLPQMKARL
jgi:hypothetical protein